VLAALLRSSAVPRCTLLQAPLMGW
jgi:hypothetical protein